MMSAACPVPASTGWVWCSGPLPGPSRLSVKVHKGCPIHTRQNPEIEPCLAWVVLLMRVPFSVLFEQVPHYIGDPEGAPNLENYPHTPCQTSWKIRKAHLETRRIPNTMDPHTKIELLANLHSPNMMLQS